MKILKNKAGEVIAVYIFDIRNGRWVEVTHSKIEYETLFDWEKQGLEDC